MKHGRELRVGIFVMTSVLIGGAIAFTVGSASNVFASKTAYTIIMPNAGGLRPGSPVHVAGVPVGSVQSVRFTEDGEIGVRFELLDELTDLVRGTPEGPHPHDLPADAPRGSVASVEGKGMLGDMLLSITVGHPSLPLWPPEQPLPVDSSGGLIAMATEAMESVSATAENLRIATRQFATPEFERDVQAMTHNLAEVSRMFADGNGTIQKLMTDEATAREVDATLANVREASLEIALLGRSARRITNEIESGNGSLHQIIYGPDAVRTVRSIGDASSEVALALEAIRTGDGTAHDLIYGHAADEMIANMTQASEDIAAITAGVRAGRGTIGGLLVDPSIYEDVKRLVGDLQRNRILRAMVRYSISRDGSAEAPEVVSEAE